MCTRYYEQYGDEHDRYGPRGAAWCVHDNQHILNWAALDLSDYTDLDTQLAWLGRLLDARDFPMDRFVRNLEIAAEVTAGHSDLSERLTRAAREFSPPS